MNVCCSTTTCPPTTTSTTTLCLDGEVCEEVTLAEDIFWVTPSVPDTDIVQCTDLNTIIKDISVFSKAEIIRILTIIKGNETLTLQFCGMVEACGYGDFFVNFLTSTSSTTTLPVYTTTTTLANSTSTTSTSTTTAAPAIETTSTSTSTTSTSTSTSTTSSTSTSTTSTTSTTTVIPCPEVGDDYSGGVVFHLTGVGDQTVYIAAPADDVSAPWGCNGVPISGADSFAVGAGEDNTDDILALCVTPGIAAQICNVHTELTYIDYFLPSVLELIHMYNNRVAIGGFDLGAKYWSSTEFDANNAWTVDFATGVVATEAKTDSHAIRAIRTQLCSDTVPTTTSSTTLEPTTTTTLELFEVCGVYGLAMDSVSENLNRISAGEITSTSGVIGDYIIEWVLQGPNTVLLTTGVDEEITHPFTDALVQGGVYQPVITFIFIDGELYTPDGLNGGRYAPDLTTCLSQVIVEDFNCESGDPEEVYANTLLDNYLGGTFRFYHSATSNYFVWKLSGLEEAIVRISITHVSPSSSTNTLLDHWEVGTYTGDQFISLPYGYLSDSLKMVSDLTPFVGVEHNADDYLLITLEVDYGTEYQLDFGCKETLDISVCDFVNDDTMFCDVSLTEGAPCEYQVNMTYSDDCVYTSDLYTYFEVIHNEENPFEEPLILGEECFPEQIDYAPDQPCNPTNSTYTLDKTGNILTFTFVDEDDYLLFKNSYLSIYGNAVMFPSYSATVTDLNHYKFISIWHRNEFCGEEAEFQYMFHITSPVTFDDVLFIIEIEILNVLNEYVDDTCEVCNNVINQPVSVVQSGLTTLDGTITGLDEIRENPFSGTYMAPAAPSITFTSVGIAASMPDEIFGNGLIDFTDWCPGPVINRYNISVTVTDINDAENNFIVYDNLDTIGCVASPLPRFIMSGGVVTDRPEECPSTTSTTTISTTSTTTSGD